MSDVFQITLGRLTEVLIQLKLDRFHSFAQQMAHSHDLRLACLARDAIGERLFVSFLMVL